MMNFSCEIDASSTSSIALSVFVDIKPKLVK